MVDELWPSICDVVRLSVQSAFNDVETACVAGDIEVPTDLRDILSLTPRCVQEIVES